MSNARNNAGGFDGGDSRYASHRSEEAPVETQEEEKEEEQEEEKTEEQKAEKPKKNRKAHKIKNRATVSDSNLLSFARDAAVAAGVVIGIGASGIMGPVAGLPAVIMGTASFVASRNASNVWKKHTIKKRNNIKSNGFVEGIKTATMFTAILGPVLVAGIAPGALISAAAAMLLKAGYSIGDKVSEKSSSKSK